MPGLLVVEALAATLVIAVGTRPERQRFVRDNLFAHGRHAMLRRTKLRSALLAAFALPFAAPLLANAQQKKVAPAQQSDAWLVGLPLYSSDGKKLGQITEVVTAAGQRAVRAEMGTFLGLGSTPILIPEEMVERKPDRVEIIMTASEVKTFATRQRELKAKR
jgi:PRC-barrel domain